MTNQLIPQIIANSDGSLPDVVVIGDDVWHDSGEPYGVVHDGYSVPPEWQATVEACPNPTCESGLVFRPDPKVGMPCEYCIDGRPTVPVVRHFPICSAHRIPLPGECDTCSVYVPAGQVCVSVIVPIVAPRQWAAEYRNAECIIVFDDSTAGLHLADGIYVIEAGVTLDDIGKYAIILDINTYRRL